MAHPTISLVTISLVTLVYMWQALTGQILDKVRKLKGLIGLNGLRSSFLAEHMMLLPCPYISHIGIHKRLTIPCLWLVVL